MAIIKEGINGPFSGKVGNVVGASWKDINYIRAAPRKKKSKKRSAARLSNEGRFARVNRWLAPFKPFASIGLMNYSGRMTAYNALYSLNHKLLPEPGVETEINYADMILSEGPLPGTSGVRATITDDGCLELVWDGETTLKGKSSDELMLVIYDPEYKICDTMIGGVKRQEANYRYKPQFAIHQGMQVFIAFTSIDRKKVSRSQHVVLGEES